MRLCVCAVDNAEGPPSPTGVPAHSLALSRASPPHGSLWCLALPATSGVTKLLQTCPFHRQEATDGIKNSDHVKEKNQ